MTKHQQHSYLQALGIPVWVRRTPSSTENVAVGVSSFATSDDKMSSIQSYIEDLNITDNIPDSKPTKSEKKDGSVSVDEVDNVDKTESIDSSQMDWQTLQSSVATCQQCVLHSSRNQAILGNITSNNISSKYMVIGDAPSSEEDLQNHVLAGQTGQLLSKMLLAIDLSPDSVYLTHTVKCRTPNNRAPLAQEQQQCMAYLDRQIELIQPTAILILGRVTAQHLLQRKEPLSKLHGQVHKLPDTNIPVIATYHPRNLLKQPRDKRKAWEDLKLFRKLFAEQT